MLSELYIKDFAIIDEIRLQFTEGFNVITGETGAGKSILIDAVSVVLGSQADRDFVRSGAEKAIIEAIFKIPTVLQPIIQPMLDEEEIDYDTLDELMFAREIRSTGRNVARINGVVCKVSAYKEIGSLLIDLHGQSDHLSLLKPKQHIYLLDRYANLEDSRKAIGTVVRRLHQVRREIDQFQQDEAALARRVEMLEYQVQEIEDAKLKPNEETNLKEESNRLANSEKLMEYSRDAEQMLFADDVGESGAVEMLEEASLALSRLALLDPSAEELSEIAEQVSIQAEELADSVRRYGQKIDISPGRLDEVEERLAFIANLKRKYGSSVSEVLEYAQNAREELENITHSEARMEALEKEEEELLQKIGELGIVLSKARLKAGETLAKLIEKELRDLRMEAARFEVRIDQREAEDGCYVDDVRLAFDATGIDEVEFMLATNFGEPMKPLAKVASGGETARSMLALKAILSQADQVPTLIFDEIDQGIGGRLGSVLGEKMWRLAKHHQVLSITHLAQLGSFADTHFRVSKQVNNNRTITLVLKLDPGGRLAELTEMLGSEASGARQNARDLLVMATEIKSREQYVELGSSTPQIRG